MVLPIKTKVQPRAMPSRLDRIFGMVLIENVMPVIIAWA
jgi:hypothetical protein|tara:strand:+ start:418 stop:534 length:117 start_codon:yes stop_codon:yes gene_type:complete